MRAIIHNASEWLSESREESPNSDIIFYRMMHIHAKVAYIPNRKTIGLSKIKRIVRFFAQRPQVQERLTQQVLVALQTLLESEHDAVTIDAKHYCVKARGVMDANSSTQTAALGWG